MSTLALHIHLFGLLELALDGESLPAPSSLKARSLLAYLILHHDQPVSRDRLTGLFWPERPDARARRALSQALWQIRSGLGPAADRLMAERDVISFLSHPDDWLDVGEFEEKTGISSAPVLSEAVALYRADFLEECYDDWALLERERLRELYLGALERLITLHKQRDDYEQALTYAQRLAAADPLRESAHRELMRLYHLLGRSQAALKQFATLRDLLEQELAVSPTPATVALCQEINAVLEEAVSTHLPVAPPPPPLLRDLAHLPLVGRANERAALLYGLQMAVQDHGGMALVEGDAGVGKTRLVSAIASDAEWRGFQVGLGKADPLAVSTPYQLLRDALSSLLTPLRITQLAELVEPEQLSAVALLFPSIVESLSTLPSLVSLDSHEEQERLQAGLARCITGLATVAPLLLVLEDLHWADETTLAALLHLAHGFTKGRVFVILTYRTAEARERTGVWETLEALDRVLGLSKIRLLPFERVEALALVQRALNVGEGDARVHGFVQRLQGETGGNALFLVETLKSLVEQGTLAPASGGGWQFPSQDLPLLPPTSVQELIGGRLDRLGALSRQVLELTAVLGDDADFATLSKAGNLDSSALLPTLEELGWRGFLVEAEAEARYRFEHDRIQETVYQAIEPGRRRTLHQLAGATLEEQSPEQVESIARHFSLGEVWDKAAAYNLRAGDRAKGVYAGGEAIGYYTQALDAWEHFRSSNVELGIDLYQARGEVCQETGRFDQAEADFQAALDLAEKANDKAGQARAINHASYLQFQRGNFEDAIRIAQQALALATMADDSLEIAAALFNEANATRNLGHYRDAIEPYERAAAIFERLDEQVRLADCINRMGFALLFTGDCAKTLSVMERGLAIRRRLDDKVGISYSLINLSYLYFYQGQLASAEQAAREALEVAEAVGDPYGEDAAAHCLGMAILEQGHPTRAIPFFQRALEIAQKIGDRPLEPEALAGLGIANCYLGHLEQAQEALEHALRMASVSVEIEQVPEIHARLAQLFLVLGKGKEALAQARAGLEVAQELDEPRSLGLTHRMMGEVIAHLGTDRVAPYFEESIRILRETGARAELARSLAAYGLYLCQSAGDEEAQSAPLLDEARELSEELGMTRDLAQLQADVDTCLHLGQVPVRLPHADAPIGRPLRDDEFVDVVWTVTAPEDDQVSGRVARRRHRLLRLLREAEEQSAAPTVTDLAAALDVSKRTIKRDLAALRADGREVQTRGARG